MKKSEKNKKIKIILLIIFLFIFAFGICFLVNKYNNSNTSNEDTEIKVPDVVGVNSGTAQEILEKLGLKVKIKETVDDSKEKQFGKVYKQNITGKIKKKKTIILSVYVSSIELKMPDVIGMNKNEAKDLLEKLGFSVSLIGEVNAEKNEYIVLRQESSSDKIVKGTTITLYYSTKEETNEDDKADSELEDIDLKNGKCTSTKWSGWVTSLPENVNNSSCKIESRVEYRYQTKESTSSDSSSLSGWTFVSSTSEPVYSYDKQFTIVTKDIFNTYLNNSNYKIESMKKSENQWFVVAIHCDINTNGTYTSTVPSGLSCVNGFQDIFDFDVDKKYNVGDVINGIPCTLNRSNSNSSVKIISISEEYEIYFYKKISTKTVYYFERWTDWSNWSTNFEQSSSTKNVEQRTVYRYKKK